MAFAYALHVLFAVVWVGGMIFAQLALRPVAVAQLEPPRRIAFLTAVLGRFFWLVWAAVVILPLTGFWLIAGYGGMARLGWHIHLMTGVGIVMVLIYLTLFLAVFLPLRQAVAAGDWAVAGRRLEWTRRLLWTNLLLGVLVVLTAALGARGGL